MKFASPRNLRLGTLVLLLITVNQINDPLVDADLGETLIYWVVRPIVLACGLWLADSLVAKMFANRLEAPEWLKPVVLVTAIGMLPFAIAESLLELSLPFRPEFLDDELWAVSPALAFLGEYLTIASVVMPLHLVLWLIIDRQSPRSDESPEQDAPPVPEFLLRTAGIDAGDVIALQADEHYVRVFSQAGSELIHYRFRNAVEQMPDSLGLQVHRSWWVAERAVLSASRGSRRWQLRLEGDLEAPVSDSFVAAARARGWLRKKA